MKDAPASTSTAHLTYREAAEACGVHEDTIRRAYRAGKLPNAKKGARGAVLIPVSDLLLAGYKLTAQPQSAPERPESESPDRAEVIELRAALEATKATQRALESQLAEMRATQSALLEIMKRQALALPAGAAPGQRRGWRWKRTRTDLQSPPDAPRND
jgi:excisionase family DNA binding protein